MLLIEGTINQTESQQIKTNQTLTFFSERGKTSQSRVENQQTQPTYDGGSGHQSQATLVEGECSSLRLYVQKST